MAFGFLKIWEGLKIKSRTSTAADGIGDLEVITSTGRLQYHDGTAVRIVSLQPSALTSGRIPYVDSNGQITDDSGLTFNSTNDAITATGGLLLTVPAAKTTGATLTLTEEVIRADATSGSFTLTLPAASGNTGKVYSITKVDTSSNSVIIDGNSSETIFGDLTVTLTDNGQAVRIVCDGSNWVNAGGAGASSTGFALVRRFTQASHGFSVGKVITYSSSTWNTCDVSSEQGIGVVSKVVDANTFEVCFAGYLSGLSGLTANTQYYCSTTGTLSSTQAYYVQPIGYAISTTEMIVNVQRREEPKKFGTTLSKTADVSFTVTSGNELVWPRVDIQSGITITLNSGSEMVARDVYGSGSVAGSGNLYSFV